MESFYTIQGEGFHSGTPAYFIRLGGCDVGCHWCDVKESWEKEDHPNTLVSEIVDGAAAYNSEVVVITGGEPLMYNLQSLTDQLCRNNKKIHLETSGAYPLTGNWNWICFSPKKFKKPLQEFYDKSHELKVIVFNHSDLKWASDHAEKMNSEAQLFLQPEWSKEAEVLPSIIQFVKDNPKWKISLQMHKYMSIP